MQINIFRVITSISFLSIAFLVSPVHAAVVTLNSGKMLEGEVLEKNDEYIEIDVGIGLPMTFYMDQIRSIDEKAPSPQKEGQEQDLTGDKDSSAFLWEVVSDETTVYLFGSIHLGKPDMFPLADVVENAFAGSDYLVVEVNIEDADPIQVQQLMTMRGMYTDGSRLERNISQKALIRLRQRLRKYGLRSGDFTSFKPWVVAVMLMQIQITELGFDERYGIDRYFMRRAKKTKKQILELETLESQFSLLDELPDQSRFLEYSLISMEETEAVLTELIQSWKSGDAQRLKRITIDEPIEEEPELSALIQKILFDRNYDMVKEIERYLGTNKVYFVVVGAGHLVGDQGIPALLRKQGYNVKQL